MEGDVILRDRRFSGAMVRDVCNRVYGSRISRNAWANWRAWAGVRADKRTYTFDQFCFLFAVALIRSRQTNRYRELAKSEIIAIAQDDETIKTLGDFVDFFDSRFVLGSDAPRLLAAKGVRVSMRTLYRNVPGFSMSKVYQVEHLREWAIA